MEGMKVSPDQLAAWEQALREQGWAVDDLVQFKKQCEREVAWLEHYLGEVYSARSRMRTVDQVMEWEAEKYRVETRISTFRRVLSGLQEKH